MEHNLIEDMQPRQQELEFSIVSPRLTLEAMRDSGYKSTDHALAELIDNSVDAGASLVEIIAVEAPPNPNQAYARARVSEIAVADNGEGMDKIILRRALRFGDGTRLDRRKRGIGRFGVGLPQSSISQCQRVDIWSWQNGPDNAFHCYLDLDEIKNSGRGDVPEPSISKVPDRWRRVVSNTSEQTGTLVVWSKLDRVRLKGGAKNLKQTADLCGRIYRKYLTDDKNQILINLMLATCDENNCLIIKHEEDCPPNDPLYLMCPSSTPKPFQDQPMFKLFNERKWLIKVDGIEGQIHVRCTMARSDAINEKLSNIAWPKSYPKAGSAPWGKHADKNKGVSIVRARRELEMSTAWVNNHEPEERWWSIEIEFDPVFDDIFGVVNNKQHANIFVSGAGFDNKEGYKEYLEDDETYGQFVDRLQETSDPRYHLVEIWNWINDQIRQMREERRKIMRGTGPEPRHPQTGVKVEDSASDVINDQKERGEMGDTDNAPIISNEEKIGQMTESAKQFRVEEKTARKWAEETVHSGRRVQLKSVTLGHRDAFFDVEPVNDVIQVWLNDRHPVYEHFIDVLTSGIEDQTTAELAERLQKASFTLRMLLIAWARYEDKSPSGMKDNLEDIRMDWGREARKFLDVIET